MAVTNIRGSQILNNTVQRQDLDTSTVGQAVVTKIVQGTNVSLSSSGADSGTGDVTVSALPAIPVGLPGALFGLTLSNDSVTPFTVLDIGPGSATSDDGTTMMVLSSTTFKKNCNAAWAVGSGNGALDVGSTLAASQLGYHVYLIERTDTGVVDVLVSGSATSPTLPTNYTKLRRIGSFLTDASAHIIAFVQLGDQFLVVAPYADIPNQGLTSGALTMLPLSIPQGIKVTALVTSILTGPIGTFVLLQSPDQPTTGANVPSGNFNLYVQTASAYAAGDFQIRSNISRQIGATASTNLGSGFYVITKGWIDNRGK